MSATKKQKTAEEKLTLDTMVTLRGGGSMPLFGLGTWLSECGGECSASVKHALDSGYRLIDTAAMYKNEEDVGKALRESGKKREDYFVVTKLDTYNHGAAECGAALKASLTKLGLDYVDLYLIHSPNGKRLTETWAAMLALKGAGLAKHVGVSNFGAKQLLELKKHTREMPEVNQIEFHCFNTQAETREVCAAEGIQVMGYCPLSRCKLIGKTKLKDIAAAAGQSEPALALRWSLQQGVITIPKSANPTRIRSNADVMSFSLSDDQMKAINGVCSDHGLFQASNACKSMDLSWEDIAF